MKANEIFELIEKINRSDKALYLIKIEGTGYIELKKAEVLTILHREYSDAMLDEFRPTLKSIRYKEMAKRMNIHPVKFTQMISGHIKSTKEIGTTLDFIAKVKSLL